MAIQISAFSQFLALFSPIHRDGYKFVAIGAGVTIILFLLSSVAGLLGVLATGAMAFFFRDPPRYVPRQEGLFLAPADGIITEIAPASPPLELDLGQDPYTRISTFLSILDVHVIRATSTGKLVASAHRPGQFMNAASHLAGKENEQHLLGFDTPAGKFGMVLIAGMLARRIVTSVQMQDRVEGGDRIGMIRFGSRVDVYIPQSAAIRVAEGQRMVAGETVLADLHGTAETLTFTRV
jgi:phosphatidylserine decarboxylase